MKFFVKNKNFPCVAKMDLPHEKFFVKKNLPQKVTNLSNKGLISEDRSTKATLLFTIPRSCLSRLHRIYLRKY